MRILAPLLQNLFNFLIIRHLRRPTSPILMLGFLELFQQVPPLVGAHSRRTIEALLSHFRRNLLPQMLIRLGSVKQTVHVSPKCYETSSLVLDPSLGSLLGGLGLVVLAAAVAENHLLLLMWKPAIGDHLDHHVAALFFFLVEIEWTRLFGQVHGWTVIWAGFGEVG